VSGFFSLFSLNLEGRKTSNNGVIKNETKKSRTLSMGSEGVGFSHGLLVISAQTTKLSVSSTNRPENMIIRYVSSVISLSSICIQSSRRFRFSFTDFSLVYRSAFAQIFPRSHPMRESNTSNKITHSEKYGTNKKIISAKLKN
jgi:hypothetical protein